MTCRAWLPLPHYAFAESTTKYEVHRADQAQAGPQIVELERLVHVEHRERDEHGERDRFLHNLELRQAVLRVPDAVGRHLQQVLEQRDPLAGKRRIQPHPVRQVL